MILKDFLPNPSLQAFVRCYRIVHMRFDSNDPPPFKPYTPRPEQCLAFYPHDRERVDFTAQHKSAANVSVALVGQALSVTNRFIHGHFMVVQILFQPGGLYRLTGMPSCEINDAYIEADFVFPKEVHMVNEAFFFAKTYQEIVQIADGFMERLVRKSVKESHPIDQVCQWMLSNPTVSLDNLAKKSFLSSKQFERKFQERTGVNPKTFSRLVRFDKAFREKNQNPHRDWQTIAFDCNYYDYQHLVRDYKDFTGLKPTDFHQLESHAPERRFGLAEHYYETQLG
ncbi:MAG: AraC family transcriptional regulator [Saprospiraceae bacterium]|nr:AraC family transcriptional regulator [Saprospiraceae bacterium]